MKRFRRSRAGKITGFILCVLAMSIFFVSFVSTFYMAYRGVYSDTQEDLMQYQMEEEMDSDAFGVIYNVVNNRIDKWRDGSYPMTFSDDLTSGTGEASDDSVTYQDIYSYIEWSDDDVYTADHGNLMFTVTDVYGGVEAAHSEVTASADNSSEYTASYAYAVTYTGDAFDVTRYGSVDDAEYYGNADSVFTMDCVLQAGLPVDDNYRIQADIISVMYAMKYAVLVADIAAFVITVLLIINLMCVSGRTDEDDELHSRFMLPLDLSIVIILALMFVFVLELKEVTSYGSLVFLILSVLSFIVGEGIITWFFMTLALRVKTRTFFKNNVIYMICDGIAHLPAVGGTALILVIGIALEIILMLAIQRSEAMIVIYVIEKIILVPVLLKNAMSIARLKKGSRAIANGEVDHVIDTKGLHGVYREQAEDLNRVSEGMELAVDEKVRAERMKTELITNVSHDIKTPLTSIINYSGLIREAEKDNETTAEYCEVLERQSNRLKRLIEDLVEASKASTGSLEVELVPSDACILMVQASGDYDEKLEKAGLSIVLKVPEEPVMIMADGRRMWRIFDNLMNNICKYSQENTRVYMSLEQVGDEAVITFKNTSRDALDITEEELMERFVRGDRSRNTDGNGLGLSIARSLAELQGGSLVLDIDGDLFKAILKFPVIEEVDDESTGN